MEQTTGSHQWNVTVATVAILGRRKSASATTISLPVTWRMLKFNCGKEFTARKIAWGKLIYFRNHFVIELNHRNIFQLCRSIFIFKVVHTCAKLPAVGTTIGMVVLALQLVTLFKKGTGFIAVTAPFELPTQAEGTRIINLHRFRQIGGVWRRRRGDVWHRLPRNVMIVLSRMSAFIVQLDEDRIHMCRWSPVFHFASFKPR
ncbi:hypothetical protein PsorP6_014605 [Peronosclerospora sorghi]|uniref:Uncharacterized protein n=1 Tax=Peronosclerospora sorghi TaxID=230839 RepID=A0ACC0VUP4_9STRA|nr:hypothetical protein PsorP6_014605 [Peronosclerospora sorghi]